MVAGDRYIAEVLENLFGSAADKERLASDLRAHFNDGRAAGESESEIVGRLGPPKEVAASFIEGSPTVVTQAESLVNMRRLFLGSRIVARDSCTSPGAHRRSRCA